ncbi:sulfurtransferase [Erythrobacter sanguineus]|uniref:Thiosulfate/3-mercaptopyruvate sulfurtransferase n=1 Tax=Erythrobacter sanguineus TaxID=198312 RepID=A0A1M7RQE1_9SPHN|nr:sulfurtransferase [Erythrobacter sanguineus]SHN48316.1 thiosulfate/3-mercaptopyruvate sulfurtransferase [Erythrobacter sanguineus]
MTETFPSLVSTDWLAAHLGDPGLAVLDASRHLPAARRDPRAEFAAAHIPGARFLDLAALVDETSATPQALPRPSQLADMLAMLGVAPGSRIVLYDDSAVRTAARGWFMLTACGWRNVAILDGGLAKWRAEGRALESGRPDTTPGDRAALAPPQGVRSKADMLANLQTHAEQVVDARGADRVFGTGIDPVHGGPMGRIPGSLNVPYSALFGTDGTYKPPHDLHAAFVDAGVDLDRPVTTTCGSGVTASVLLFAMHLLGKHDTALYDGSWSEWGADPATPKAQGPGT